MSALYLDHFGLSKPPFQITPDPDFFFTGGRRGDILSALAHVATNDEGITTVVAEVGSMAAAARLVSEGRAVRDRIDTGGGPAKGLRLVRGAFGDGGAVA